MWSANGDGDGHWHGCGPSAEHPPGVPGKQGFHRGADSRIVNGGSNESQRIHCGPVWSARPLKLRPGHCEERKGFGRGASEQRREVERRPQAQLLLPHHSKCRAREGSAVTPFLPPLYWLRPCASLGDLLEPDVGARAVGIREAC